MEIRFSPFLESKFDSDREPRQSLSCVRDFCPFGRILMLAAFMSGALPSATSMPIWLSEHRVLIVRQVRERASGCFPNANDLPLMVMTAVPGELAPKPESPDP